MRSISKLLTFALAAVLLSGTATVPSLGSSVEMPKVIQDWLASDMTASQWGPRAVNAPAAREAGFDGNGVIVAVIDTGVDASHADLKGQVLAGMRYIAIDGYTGFRSESVRADQNVDLFGHGTHVAGIIAAKDNGQGIVGVAPAAKILPIALDLSLMEAENSLFYEALADAVLAAGERGAKVINMSLGVPAVEYSEGGQDADYDSMVVSQEKVCKAIRDVRDEFGTVSLVSSGNERSQYLNLPAGCDAAVSVGSLDSDLRPSYFSSADETVDVAAPGAKILSTMFGSYAVLDGTSMAAPHAAGVAALLMQQNPRRGADWVVSQMEDSALDVGVNGFDVRTGHGLVDAAAALGVPAPTVVPQESFAPYFRDATSPFPESTVYWDPPMQQNVAGYTVYELNVTTGEMTETQLGPWALRFKPVPLDGKRYLRVVANLVGGGTLDGGWTFVPNFGGGQTLPSITGVKAKRMGVDKQKRTKVRVSWDVPADPSLYEQSKLNYFSVLGATNKHVQVDIRTGAQTVKLSKRQADEDFIFSLRTTRVEDEYVESISSDTVLPGKSFAVLLGVARTGRRAEVFYCSNPSAAPSVKPTKGKDFVMEARPAGRGTGKKYRGKMKKCPASSYGMQPSGLMTLKLRLPARTASRPEFRVKVRNGKEMLTSPWRLG